jgi:quinol monooxygenase YgiN
MMFVGDLRQRRAVVDVKQARYARIAQPRGHSSPH